MFSVCSSTARHYLRLHLVEGIGPILAARLIERFGDIERVFNASIADLQHVDGIGATLAERISRSSAESVDAEIDLAAQHRVRIVCPGDADYPTALRNIPDPPLCLYVRGTLEPEDAIALAVVGSRHCSAYGGEQADRFSAMAAETGFTIVSGLARGVDEAAHRGALRARGRTFAVLGCGMCHLYPPTSRELAERIVTSGAVLSEFPMRVAPDEGNFPRRNRIIAGLSLGVLVVEAASRSGALITARMATEYNREVFAIPGRVDSPHAEGCHRLIRSGGAKLVACLTDILDELGPVAQTLRQPAPAGVAVDEPAATAPPPPPTALSEYEKRLYAAFPPDPVNIDTLVALAEMTPARVAATLVSLQLKGLVRRVGHDLYSNTAQA